MDIHAIEIWSGIYTADCLYLDYMDIALYESTVYMYQL